MAQIFRDEIIYLKDNFRVVDYAEDVSVSLDELLDEEFLLSYLNDISEYFNTDNIFIVGSQLMKRLAFNVVLPPLYLMTVHRMKLDLDFRKMWIAPNIVGDLWLPNLYLEDFTVEELPDDERKTYLSELFNKINDLVNVISKVTRVPKPNLWENMAVYIYWLYEKKFKDDRFVDVADRVAMDFEFLVHRLGADAFDGMCNQLKNFYWGRRIEEDGTRIRRTCCFHYGANEARKTCKTCPHTEESVKKPLPFEKGYFRKDQKSH
ncbi:(2Fe-2S)-binding protein [Bacillaceae bacterium W0354]